MMIYTNTTVLHIVKIAHTHFIFLACISFQLTFHGQSQNEARSQYIAEWHFTIVPLRKREREKKKGKVILTTSVLAVSRLHLYRMQLLEIKRKEKMKIHYSSFISRTYILYI